MNRFVEGRGHQREIDMLLEITYVATLIYFIPTDLTLPQKTSRRANDLCAWRCRRLAHTRFDEAFPSRSRA